MQRSFTVVVRWGAATILLLAASLKAHHLLVLVASNFKTESTSDWISLVLFWEIALGWRLTSLPPSRLAWCPAIASFSVFAIFAAFLTIRGADSCGCFGRLQIAPTTTLGLDLAAVALLSVAWRVELTSQRNSIRNHSEYLVRSRLLFVVVAVGLFISNTIYPMMSMSTANRLPGVIAIDRDVVMLSPKEWIGGRLPILDKIDTDRDLGHGEWLVALVRNGCGKCETLVNRLDSMVMTARGISALVVDLNSRRLLTPRLCVPVAPLRNQRQDEVTQWICEVPTLLQLEDGEVRAILRIDEGDG